MRLGRGPLALTLVLAACGSSADTTTTAAAEPTSTTATTVATTTTTTVAATTTTTTTIPATTATTSLPEQADLGHGGTAYAAYLGAAEADGFDPAAFDAAHAAAEDLGYDISGYGDVHCDQGALEALDLDPDQDWFVTGLYFATEADANAFADAYPLPVLAIAEVTTFCLD